MANIIQFPKNTEMAPEKQEKNFWERLLGWIQIDEDITKLHLNEKTDEPYNINAPYGI